MDKEKSKLSLIFDLLKNSKSGMEYIQIAKGKHKKPNTIREIIKHTRNGKRN